MKTEVVKEIVSEDGTDQRIDNFLFKRCKNVPKSHIYQLLRSGQVRVNGKRIDFHYRLAPGDLIRIPPITVPATATAARRIISKTPLLHIIFEDEALLVINKPSGIAVHGGSGISFGIIEQLRAQHPEMRFLELAHRLDRETSGVLLLAKKRSALVALHQQIRSGHTEKHYQVLVRGKWPNTRQHVKLPLIKYVTKEGERRVTVATGKHHKAEEKTSPFKAMDAHTVFTLLKTWRDYSLLNAELKTGRTHQIRVHLAHLGYPIIGDSKYGDFVINKRLSRSGSSVSLDRMFLHAASMRISHPLNGQPLELTADLPADLRAFLSHLDA
ncbi:MAG: RluA family pseudouridine synthase [Nitrosomonas sp.]|nr:RluA family pseudouridine synthase [Nitrosomonas sp.]